MLSDLLRARRKRLSEKGLISKHFDVINPFLRFHRSDGLRRI